MSIRILLVDDSATIRKLVGKPLKEAGFEVLEAEDGSVGVDRIRAGGVDFVICDLNLPKKNGIELIEEIKSETQFQDLPIVMLSNEMSEELLCKAKLAGACGWILKPCDPPLIVATVKGLTEKLQRQT